MTLVAQRGLAPSREILDNGAIVIAKTSPTPPAVTISAAFHAGSVYDSPAVAGLAYFLSRVIDRGTERRSAEQIADELDSRGISLTVNVSRHVLTLTCTCLAEDFEAVLELVGDIAIGPTLPEEEVEKRRGEIVTAIRQDEDNPAVLAIEGLFTLLYRGHPYSRRVKGSVESVEAIDRHAVQAFHRERFAPSSLTLVIVGDVEAARASAAAGRVLAGWQAGKPEPARLPRVVPASTRQQLVLPMMNKAQADIAYGFTTIVRADPAYYAFWILNNALGQYSLGGRLGDSIRERQGMAYYVFSSLDANVVEGPLIIRAGVNPANVERAVASIDEEIAKVAAEGISEKELADCKQYLIGSMPRNLETNAGIATFLQTVAYFGLGLDYDLRLPGLLNAVTRDEVHEAARRALSPDRAAVVIAGPYEPKTPPASGR